MIRLLSILCILAFAAEGQEVSSLERLKKEGAGRSKYLSSGGKGAEEVLKADLAAFETRIEPILKKSCVECHGPEKQKGKFRVDTLDPDLSHGDDADWWLEVMDVMTNGEMPPPDEDVELSDPDRTKVIDWLASEIQTASRVHRSGQKHSSFRRMTRYEYNYALQDLLGLELDFAKDLPPEPVSEDGFKNSSEMLRISPSQYADYLKLNRDALNRAIVSGDQPDMLYWGVSAERAFLRGRRVKEKGKRDRQRGGGGVRYENIETGQAVPATWAFRLARHAWAPEETRPEVPEASNYIGVLPVGQRVVVELGNRLPDEGILRVRVRAWRVSGEVDKIPSLALEFGWQGNNNSKGSFEISRNDLEIDGPPGERKFYQWDIPLSEIYPRNPARKTVELGTPKRTNPSEYIRLNNTSLSESADIRFDYVEVSTPVYEEWPPASHQKIFIESESREDETVYTREIVSRFMKRAWRRNVTDAEVDRKMSFFARIRHECDNFEQAVVEVLSTVLSSPRFLYLVHSERSLADVAPRLDEFELATRLSMFLWCSLPDAELLKVAEKGQLSKREVLVAQTNRMLADPRHERFSERFVRQWLDMELLDYLQVDKSSYPEFDRALQKAMKQEPIAFFEEMLGHDHSVMDFLHADYTTVNQRLAQHYGINDVYGPHFRKVPLRAGSLRGGLLTQAGLLAMNSDGADSNPLKRGIWILESILNDPPPPPPPAVPEIDLADPKILQMTLKERMEDHRNKPACFSCHQKIDPWGIALENFDATGSWRTKSRGRDIDASSLLFNQERLDGVEGLKRYLLSNRQDQFARAIVHKMITFAMGRPMTFSDRASVDGLTAELRKNGDGLATLVTLIVTSDLFQSH